MPPPTVTQDEWSEEWVVAHAKNVMRIAGR
jgi:hypothetical protein